MYRTQVITPPANLSESQIEKVITILISTKVISRPIYIIQLIVLSIDFKFQLNLRVEKNFASMNLDGMICRWERERKIFKRWRKLQILKEKRKITNCEIEKSTNFQSSFLSKLGYCITVCCILSELSEFNRSDINSYLFYFRSFLHGFNFL